MTSLERLASWEEHQRRELDRDLGVYADAPEPPPHPADVGRGDSTPVAVSGVLPTPIDWAEFWQRDRIEHDWMVEPILPRGRQVTIWAKHKSGKSLLSLEVAAALGTGRPVLGRRAGEPVVVAYVDMEMTADDLEERLVDLGYGPDDDLSHLHYYLLPDLPPLDHPEGGKALLQLVQRDRAEVVVLDTVARVTAGDENSADTIRAYYRWTGLHLKAAGVTVLRLDHGGKDADRGARGSSGKGDDVDLEFRMDVNGNAVTLVRTLSRLSWVPEKVVLTRCVEPLRHLLGGDAYPPGTAEVAARLAAAGVSLEATLSAATGALKALDGKAANRQTLAAALRYRRTRHDLQEAR